MRLSTSTDMRPEVGEVLALRIGDVVIGAEVVDYVDGTVILDLPDSELMRPSRVGHESLPSTVVPATGEVGTWVAASRSWNSGRDPRGAGRARSKVS